MQTYMHVRVIAIRFFNFMLRIIGISRRCHLIDEKMIVCFFHSFKTIRIEKLLSWKSLPERPNNF